MKNSSSILPRFILWGTLISCSLLLGYALLEYYGVQTKTTQVYDFYSCKTAGYPIMESSPERCRDGNGNIYIQTPAPIAKATLPLIVVSAPVANSFIASPTTIKGFARGYWFFEASAPVVIVDDIGNIVAEGPIETVGNWMTESYVPFSGTLTWKNLPSTPAGKILLRNDNPSGLEELDRRSEIPVLFQEEATNEKKVNLFFAHSNMGSSEECTLVFPVVRSISATTSIAQATTQELLRGPTEQELSQGYASAIPKGTRLKNISLKDRVLSVDFSEELSSGVAGSCTVGMIRAQIEETLRQFSTVEKVIVSVNGESELILQP